MQLPLNTSLLTPFVLNVLISVLEMENSPPAFELAFDVFIEVFAVAAAPVVIAVPAEFFTLSIQMN